MLYSFEQTLIYFADAYTTSAVRRVQARSAATDTHQAVADVFEKPHVCRCRNESKVFIALKSVGLVLRDGMVRDDSNNVRKMAEEWGVRLSNVSRQL